MISLVNAAGNGDFDAMAKLYSSTLRTSYFLAGALSNDPESAIEITKKSYARAFCTIKKLKKPEAFEIWMKQNVAAVYKETQKFTFEDAEAGTAETSMEFLSEDVLEDPDKSYAAFLAVSELKPEQRTAVILHYFSGMPITSLSKFLGVSESTANALLQKGKAEIFEKSGSGEPAATPLGAYPVLTRLFQNSVANVQIENADVVAIFQYAQEIYASFKESEAAKIQERLRKEEEERKAAENPEEAEFRARINEIITINSEDGETDEPSGPPEIPNKHEGYFSGEHKEESDEMDFGAFQDSDGDAPAGKGFSLSALKNFDFKKIKDFEFKGIGIKKLAIALVALIALICIIAGIAKSCGKKDNGGNTSISAEEAGFKFVSGGLEDCASIEYLDENCCMFKSATTGKYGLLNYKGEVILQPNYDGFSRCGSGRDYSRGNSYHTLVLIDGQHYQLTIDNNNVVIADTPHSAHTIETDDLGTKHKYDERDRYFEGYAAARKDGKWGYVSKETDKKVIPYEYEAVNDIQHADASMCDYCRPVSNGLIPVKKNGKMGIINLDNDIIVGFEYTNIMPGSNGIFLAQKDNVWGAIAVGDAAATFTGVKAEIFNDGGEDIGDVEEIKYKVITDIGANVRNDAGADFDLLGTLRQGEEIIGYGTKKAPNGKEWVRIKYNNAYAYVSLGNLTVIG